MKKFYYLSVALMAAMFFVSCSDNDDNGGTGGKSDKVRTDVVDYTVMFYSCGGANLDGDTEGNWGDALNALEVDDPNVRYMVQFKYSGQKNLDSQQKDYKTTHVWGGKAAQCYRFELTENKYNYKEQHFDLSGYEYGNQGAACQIYQPDSLANFIKYCKKVAPAKNYILLISDHGGAYSVSADYDKSLLPTTKGAMQDDTQDDELMSNKEIRTAIEKAGVHLKALIFDCCIMNNMESITEFLDLTDYYYGSGHSTIATDHEVFVKQLKAAATGGDFVKAMKTWAESSAKIHYEKYKRDPSDVSSKYVDFALTDMSKVKNIYTPLKNFVDYVVTNWDKANQASVKMAAENTYHYFNESALYDVKDYCLHLAEAFLKEDELVTDNEAFKLVNAFNQAVKDAQCFHIYTKPDANADYDLSYSVTLGAKMADDNKPAIRTRGYHKNSKKYYYMYNVEDGDQLLYWDGETTYDPKNSENKPYQTFANTYYKTDFDQKVNWIRLFKLNPYFPQNNPPTDDEGDHLRGASLIHF